MKNSVPKGNYLSCIDIYGNKLMVSRNKRGKINFTLYHNEVKEGVARQEFEDVSFNITSSSGKMFQVAKGLYEIVGDSFISSEDPIRDGRNFFFLEQVSTESYYFTVGRDLANDLNLPNQTNVEISGNFYEDLYHELSEEKAKELTKKRELNE